MNVLFYIIVMISLCLILCRTSSGKGFLSYIVSLYVVLKGLYLISIGTKISIDSFNDCLNTVVMVCTIVVLVIGVDAIFSENK